MSEPRSKGGFDLGDYVEVKERIKLFLAQYPDGRLVTDRVELWQDDGVPRIVVRALAYRTTDDPLPGVGWSWMVLPGATTYTRGSELENTETSAWGRAIGSLGIGIERSIASANEVKSKAGAPDTSDDGSLIGTVAMGKAPVDLELRITPDGPLAGFKLTQGRGGLQVLAHGNLANTLQPFLAGLVGQRVSVWGHVELIPWRRDDQDMPPFKRLILSKIKTADWTLPGDVPSAQPAGEGTAQWEMTGSVSYVDELNVLAVQSPVEAVFVPLFPDEEEAAAILAAEMREAEL